MFGPFIEMAHTESSTSLSWLQYVAEQKFAKDSRETMSVERLHTMIDIIIEELKEINTRL